MSQSPYQPPQQPYAPPPYPQPYMTPFPTDGRGRFKRASILMFVLAGVTLLFAGCMGLVSVMPFDRLPPESQQTLRDIDPNFTPDLFKQTMIMAAILTFVPAALLVVLGVGVRSAKRGWVLAALIVVGLIALYLGFSLLVALVQVARNPSAICGATLVAIPTALFVMLFVWLIGCYRAIDQLTAMTAMQQQPGYWQYAQQQQMQYPPQSGYGYGYPPQQQQHQVQPPPPDQINKPE